MDRESWKTAGSYEQSSNKVDLWGRAYTFLSFRSEKNLRSDLRVTRTVKNVKNSAILIGFGIATPWMREEQRKTQRILAPLSEVWNSQVCDGTDPKNLLHFSLFPRTFFQSLFQTPTQRSRNLIHFSFFPRIFSQVDKNSVYVPPPSPDGDKNM